MTTPPWGSAEVFVDIFYTTMTTAGAVGILSIMHSRSCQRGERLFWIAASVAVFISGVAIWFPFWGRLAEAISVGVFTVAMWHAWSSRGVRETTRTEADVKALEDRLAAILAEEDAAIRARLRGEHAAP